MYQLMLFLHIIGVAVGFVALAVVSQKKGSANQKVLMMASFCGLISILSYLFELQAKELSEMMLAVQFGYLGKCYMLVLMLIFAKQYCNVKMSPIITRGIFLFNTFILLTILTCRYHTFYYKKAELSTEGYFPHIVLTKGIGYYLYMIVTLCVVAYYCLILISSIRKNDDIVKKRLFLLLLSGIMPTVMMVLYLSGFADGIDLTPLGIIISCVILTVNVINLGLLDVMDVAKDNILENTSEGVLVTDSENNMLYINKSAEVMAEKLKDEYGITDFSSWILSKSEKRFVFDLDNRNYEVKIIQLTDEDKNKGNIAWIYDRTYFTQTENGIVL